MESSNCPDHTPLARPYSTNGLNQYESAGNIAFCYDANGNLTATRGPDPQLDSVYLYDAENRLVERRVRGAGNDNCNALSYTGALQAQLLYDPTGRLYQVSGGAAGIQRFAYDGNGMIGEYNAAGTMLRRYVHGSSAEADDPLIWYEGATQTSTLRRYLHSDPRGSIVAVTDHTGNRIAVNTYDEYGIPDTATGNDIVTKGRFRYTGQAWIPELGMYYYKARIYSPTLGRFLQTDPIGYEDQFNLYAYVGNDPVNFIDFWGLEDCPVDDSQCGSIDTITVIAPGPGGSGAGGGGGPSVNGWVAPSCVVCDATTDVSQDSILVNGKKKRRGGGTGSWLDSLQKCWAKLPADTKAGLILDGIGTAAAFAGPLGGTIANGAAAVASTNGLGSVLLNGVTSGNFGQGVAVGGTAFTIGSMFTPTNLTGAAKTVAKGVPVLGIFVAGGITAVDAYNAAVDNGCFTDG